MEKIPESPLEDMDEEPDTALDTTVLETNTDSHYIVFDYNTNIEHINKLTFKLKDIYICESTILFDNSLYTLYHNKINCPIKKTKIDIFLTYNYDLNYNKKKLLRGFLYKNNIEYEIYYYKIITSFKILNKVYDKIAICKLKLN